MAWVEGKGTVEEGGAGQPTCSLGLRWTAVQHAGDTAPREDRLVSEVPRTVPGSLERLV